MKPFKWIKKHPVEAAAIAAALVLTGGAAGVGPMAGMMGGTAGAGAAGAAGAGGASLAGTAAAAELAAPLASGGSLAGWGAGASGGSALLGGSPFIAGAGSVGNAAEAFGAGSSLLGDISPALFAENSGLMGPFTPSSAEASLFGPMESMADTKMAMGGPQAAKPGWKMTPKDAMMLSQMMGSGQQEQRPMGAPQDMGNPMQRQAMMTQEQITKRWLLENDPNTYARIYGAPQGASYG